MFSGVLHYAAAFIEAEQEKEQVMKRKMNTLRSLIALVLALAVCAGLFAGCGKAGESKFQKEKNTEQNADQYPYLVRTPSAVWYLAAADIEQMGEEAFFAGLDRILKDQEEDFAEAQQVLSEYLMKEVPPVTIFTDFSGLSWIGEHHREEYGAFYSGTGNDISLFGNWEVAQLTLLHEYIHYLSIACFTVPITEGFWAEAVAEYVSMMKCENRMAREVNLGLDPESEAIMLALGAGDSENRIDMWRVYHGNAALVRSESAVGETYFSVSGEYITMTEEQLQHPRMSNMSYFEAACILEYLLEHYGEEKVFNHLNCGMYQTEQVYGMGFEELCAAWAKENEELCAELGIHPNTEKDAG